jgi:hypothetical protein
MMKRFLPRKKRKTLKVHDDEVLLPRILTNRMAFGVSCYFLTVPVNVTNYIINKKGAIIYRVMRL